jgi:cyclopropane fatty-acyl-phospholipid synthase-like methyltransferase
MGDHCAATLRLWPERFLQRAAEVRELRFDEVFQRVSSSAFA